MVMSTHNGPWLLPLPQFLAMLTERLVVDQAQAARDAELALTRGKIAGFDSLTFQEIDEDIRPGSQHFSLVVVIPRSCRGGTLQRPSRQAHRQCDRAPGNTSDAATIGHATRRTSPAPWPFESSTQTVQQGTKMSC